MDDTVNPMKLTAGSALGSPSYASFMTQRRFSALDGLRCISITLVIWHHSGGPSTVSLLKSGFLGVDLFFVISGFLIVTLLLRENQTRGKISLKKFYMRRALRIFPAYYGLLFGLAIIYGVFKSGDPDARLFFSVLPIYIFYLANWSIVHSPNLDILWSLSAEEQFYLLWPPLEKWLKTRAIWMAILVGLCLNQLVNFGPLDDVIINFLGLPKGSEPWILDTTFTPILLGVALAHLLNNPSSFHFVSRLLGSNFAPFLFLGSILLLVGLNTTLGDLPRLLVQLSMAGLVGSLTVREDTHFHPLLTLRPIVFIGGISYGMYLFHMWALHIVRNFLSWTGIAFACDLFIVGFTLTVCIAAVSYILMERKLLSLGIGRSNDGEFKK